MPSHTCRILALIVVTLTVACSSAAGPDRPPPPSSVRLYVFDCGELDIPDTSNYRLTPSELATTKMAVPCFLVVHPEGTLMWDVGAVPDTSFRPDGSHAPLRYAKATRPLGAQLAEIGYAPADITYLSFSHFHWDHVGNANLFAPHVTWLVRKLEHQIMFADPPSPRTEPANYDALRRTKTIIMATPDYDVFGDATVVLKSAPGHSPDHQVLYVRLAKTGPVVLSGDLYHYPEERTLNRVPTTEFNAAQTAESRAALDRFLKRAGAKLWIQHDFTAFGNLRKAPEFYE